MSLWQELHRRNVVKVGVTYAVMSWLLIQIAVNTFPSLGLPDWASTLVIVLLLLGCPVALPLAWAYEITASSALWLQRLGSLEAQPLAGTDGAAFPFWSPDGRNVAFGAGQRLKRIGVNGAGAAQDVAQFDGFFGGTWGADGFILFAARKGVFRVAAPGGDPVPVTRIADADPDFAHRFPVLFPDGQRFLYLVVNSDPALDGLYVGSLSDPMLRQRITSSDSNGMLAAERSSIGRVTSPIRSSTG
jgi:hypothetical protein